MDQPITPEDLQQYRRDCCTHDCNQGDKCPMRNAAHCATEIGADQRGKHRTGLLAAMWLRLVRALT